MSRLKRLSSVLVALVLVVAMVGCEREAAERATPAPPAGSPAEVTPRDLGQVDPEPPEVAQPEPTDAVTEAPPSAPAVDEVVPESNPVAVTLTDAGIDMPLLLPTGATTFTVKNDGEIPHNFELVGAGIEKTFEEAIPVGETRTLEVNLVPGEYHAYCTVEGEEEKQIRVTVTVLGM